MFLLMFYTKSVIVVIIVQNLYSLMKRQNVNEFILLSHRRWLIMLYIGRIYKWLSMVQKKQDMAGHRDRFGFDFGYRLEDRVLELRTVTYQTEFVSYRQKPLMFLIFKKEISCGKHFPKFN